MHMSLASAVRAYLADKNAAWNHEGATWNEDGREHMLATIEGPLSADAIVDAHLRALTQRATLTLVHTGTPTAVAQRTAARFGITLIDAATLPHADASDTFAVPPSGEASPVAELTPFDLGETIASAWSDALDAMDRRDARTPPAPPAIVPEFPLPAPGFFRALERAPTQTADAADAFAAMDALAVVAAADPSTGVGTPVEAPATGVPTPVEPPFVVAASEPDPELARVDPALPWDLSLSAPEPEPVHVEPTELASMPWNLHSEQHELLSAGRAARFVQPRLTVVDDAASRHLMSSTPARPTAVAQDWGLPWPRPVVPTGGLSIADPRVWHAQERIEQVREDLQKVGAPSFGAVKPEGSAWLKRLNEFGAP